MATRSLRNRIVTVSEEESNHFGDGELELCRVEGSLEENERLETGLGSSLEIVEQEEVALRMNDGQQACTSVPQSDSHSYFQDMFAKLMSVMKADKLEVISSVKGEISDIRKEISSVENKIESLQRNVNNIREDVRLENERLIKRVERENSKLNKEISDKLHSESVRFSCQIKQVRDDNEGELRAAKRNMQELSNDLHNKLDHHIVEVNSVTGEITSRVIQNEEHLGQNLTKLTDEVQDLRNDMVKEQKKQSHRQGERFVEINKEFERVNCVNDSRFEKLNLEIKHLKGKLSEPTSVVCNGNFSRSANGNAASQSSSHCEAAETWVVRCLGQLIFQGMRVM